MSEKLLEKKVMDEKKVKDKSVIEANLKRINADMQKAFKSLSEEDKAKWDRASTYYRDMLNESQG
jgi:hypothetical protein